MSVPCSAQAASMSLRDLVVAIQRIDALQVTDVEENAASNNRRNSCDAVLDGAAP
jgi:hypothetical protein